MSEWEMSPGERAAYANGFEVGQKSLKAEINQLRGVVKCLLEVINEFKAAAKADGTAVEDK